MRTHLARTAARGLRVSRSDVWSLLDPSPGLLYGYKRFNGIGPNELMV